MARSSWIQNPIGQFLTVAIVFTFVFVITRHSCHRCVYLKVIVIIAVAACTFTFFLGFFRLASFLTVFRWLGKFCDKMIFRSASKAFPCWTIRIFVRWITSRTSFLFILSDIFEAFLHTMVIYSTKCALCLDRVFLLTVSIRPWGTVVKI